jgi:hypothetical protein
MHIPIAARIHLRVPDARARAHALGQTGIEEPAVSFGVLVLQLAVQHPRDDFHVAMGMGLEARARSDDIVIAHEQQPVMGVPFIIMMSKAEAMARVEPWQLRMEPLTASDDLDLGCHAVLLSGKLP